MKRIHRAWGVCLGCTLMLLISCGLCVNAYSVTQSYLLSQNGFTGAQVSLITTVRALVYLACMALLPHYYRLLGYRMGTAVSLLLGAASFVLFALARTIGVYYLAGACAGLCYGLGSMVPASILISRWFAGRRGLALGICAAGTGLATVAFSPMLTTLAEHLGLRTAFYSAAGVCALCALLVFFLIRSDPAACGETPYGTAPAESPEQRALHAVHPSRLRWAALTLAVLMICGACSTGYTNLVILNTTAGFSPMLASLALSVAGLCLMLGKCLFGASCDRLGSQKTNVIFFLLLSLGLFLSALANLQSTPLLLLSAAACGLGGPLTSVATSVWAADFSAPERYDRTLRLFQTAYGLGNLLFSPLPGLVYDRCGSYCPAFALMGVILLCCLPVIQSTYRLAHPGRRRV